MASTPDILLRIRRSYKVALGLTAVLLLFLALLAQWGLGHQKEDAHLVNMAGRQRMLSQQIAKRVLLFQSDSRQYRPKLAISIKEFSDAHLNLISRSMSKAAKQRFEDLGPSMREFIRSVEIYLLAPGRGNLAAILDSEREYLEQMELCVKALEADATERVDRQMLLEWIILAVLLTLLLVEGFTIFRPLVESLRGTLSQLEDSHRKSESALEKAVESDRLKSEFLANFSHEIRTPLNGILGSVQLMAGPLTEQEKQDYVGTISRSGEALLQIVNDVLDMSKIQSGLFELRLAPFSPSQILEDVFFLGKQRAEEKGLKLSVSIADDTRSSVLGDGLRFRQVVQNLFNNALKFTHQGEVRLGMRSGVKGWEFIVEDTGPGIPDEKIEIALSPFRQLDTGNRRVYQGTGLGLPITSELLKLMGTQLEIRPSPEGGARCSFVLNLEPASESVKKAEGSSERPGLKGKLTGRVLLVEDLPVNQKVGLKVLQKLGLETQLAENGKEALNLLDRQSFDLILMDIQMPVLDGLEATRRLRANGVETPVVALTANAAEADRDLCLAAGMNDFLTKPIRVNELREMFRRFDL